MKNLKVLSVAGLVVAFSVLVWNCFTRSEPPKVVFSVWTTESDPATIQVMEDLGRQLIKANRSVERVEVLSVKWSDLSVKLQQSYQAGRLPALTHLEPFFTKSFIDKGLLLPVDDIVREIGEQDIEPAVRRVAFFDGHYYGIPQHYGVSFIGFRSDVLVKHGFQPPKSWVEMVKVARGLSEESKTGEGVIYFPGGDRFFVDAIFFESLASNGGTIYGPKGEPKFKDEPVIATLKYLKELSAFFPKADWQSSSYVDGFPRLARGEVLINPFVGGRSTKSFDENWSKLPGHLPAPDVFHPMEPPVGPSGLKGYSSVDCEPFVIINQAKNRGIPAAQREILHEAAREYLRLLYRHDNYMRLMKTVPIQLIPIFRSMISEYGEDPFVLRWRLWYEQALKMTREKRVNPYFTTRGEDLSIPYLFDLYGDKAVTDMVLGVLAGEMTPESAAQSAQLRAESLLVRLRNESSH